MKVVLTGGGTGGHITPLLAVAQELKIQRPDIELVYIGEKGGKFSDLTEGSQMFDSQYQIYAGKFRRYNGESWLRRLVDVRTNFLNIRDAFRVVYGIWQGRRLLARLKPDVVLLKGGFVGVPIGLAAVMKHTPFITHDSDALPGLANRLVSRWARYHATGMPPEFYSYPPARIRHVGVLVGQAFQPVTPDLQAAYRHELGLPQDALVLTVTGGSLGAQRLNQAMTHIAKRLLDEHSNLHIIHQVGKGNGAAYDAFTHERLRVLEFMDGMHRYTGAADVVVTRAGANTLAELGVQGKACIVVPNPLLTGGHQLKNAEHLQAKNAVMVVDEKALVAEQGQGLYDAVSTLLRDAAARQSLGDALRQLTVPDAASKLAMLIIQTAQGTGEPTKT